MGDIGFPGEPGPKVTLQSNKSKGMTFRLRRFFVFEGLRIPLSGYETVKEGQRVLQFGM